MTDSTTENNRALATSQLWRDWCGEHGHWISPDLRVSLRTAAALLGMQYGGFRNLLTRGEGPPTYKIGGAGCQRTISLLSLAEWRESRREI